MTENNRNSIDQEELQRFQSVIAGIANVVESSPVLRFSAREKDDVLLFLKSGNIPQDFSGNTSVAYRAVSEYRHVPVYRTRELILKALSREDKRTYRRRLFEEGVSETDDPNVAIAHNALRDLMAIVGGNYQKVINPRHEEGSDDLT